MFNPLIRFTQALICGLSMVLTGLFALSFTEDIPPLSWQHTAQAAILVAMGIGLDLSKYIFWYYKHRHFAFLTLSGCLMAFSCLASMAFFVTHEHRAVTSAQQASPAYLAHQALIARTEKEMQYKERLAEQRLDSRYHSQWDKSEALLEDIQSLTRQHHELLMTLDQQGLQSARADIASSAFFLRLADALRVHYDTTAITAFACLAIFIELCALGLISIPRTAASPHTAAGHERHEPPQASPQCSEHKVKPREAPEKTTGLEAAAPHVAAIKKDIMERRTRPIVRDIMKRYTLRHKDVKSLLEALEESGIIRKAGRIYVLAASKPDPLSAITRAGTHDQTEGSGHS